MIIPVEQLRNVCAAPKRSNGTREGVLSMEWIRVTDRTPSINEAVLVYDKFIEDVSIGYISEFLGERAVWITDYGQNISDEVTHWMPLPEPPKDFNKIY